MMPKVPRHENLGDILGKFDARGAVYLYELIDTPKSWLGLTSYEIGADSKHIDLVALWFSRVE